MRDEVRSAVTRATVESGGTSKIINKNKSNAERNCGGPSLFALRQTMQVAETRIFFDYSCGKQWKKLRLLQPAEPGNCPIQGP